MFELLFFVAIINYVNMNVAVARKAAADLNLDEMVADCMKDANSDEEPSEGDDDPALLVCHTYDT